MKKPVKIVIIAAASLIAALVVFIAVSCVLFPPEYVFRCIVNQEGKTSDYKFFPCRIIAKSDSPYIYAYDIDSAINSLEVMYSVKGSIKSGKLDELAKNNDTTSLIVLHEDKVVYEQYFSGYDKDSTNTSFSAVKSIDSLMIGMAIDDGFITSETQPISDFIPELGDKEFGGITIKDLLRMRSNIKYQEGGLWFGDNAKTYYYPDLRDLALNHMETDKNYNGEFLYNNYHPLLLGIILERATGMSVSEYFRQKIWDKIGAENDASWSLDSGASGFEKMESGLNFKSIDFVKIGSMLLHRGKWNGETLISEAWLDRSIISEETMPNSPVGYQYMWYSFENGKGGYDYFAYGNHGQYLYISPDNDTVIVRTGTEEGDLDTWIDVLYQIAMYAGGN